MTDMAKMMKQAAKMQQQMAATQNALAQRTVEATSGGGAVKVVARCDGTVVSIKLNPEALSPTDAELLEEMILLAVNQALTKGKEISNDEMSKLTAGLRIPGLS